MSLTYFGNCNSSTGVGNGVDSINTGSEMDWIAAGYVCPGSGNQTLKKMGVQARSAGTYVLMGIYNSGGNLVAHSTAKKQTLLCDNASDNVWTEWDDTEITWDIGSSLTGGSTYRLVVAFASNPGVWGTGSQANGTSKYVAGDVTNTGMPSTLPAGSDYTQLLNIRAAVEPAAGASIQASGIASGEGLGSPKMRGTIQSEA